MTAAATSSRRGAAPAGRRRTLPTPHTPHFPTWVGRYGRRVTVATLAAVIAAPARWGLCAAVGGFVATGSEWAVLAGLAPASTHAAVWILTRSDQRSSILIALSRAGKSRRLRARLRRRWVRGMVRAELAKPAIPPAQPGARDVPRRGRVRLSPIGVRVEVNLSPIGRNASDLAAKMPSLLSTFGALEGKATETRPGRAVLVLRHSTPFDHIIRTNELPPARRPYGAVVGLDDDGNGVEKDMTRPNLLVGAQGSGKSTEVWTTLRALHAAGIPVRLRVFDPKGGMEFGALADVAYAYESNPAAWPEFLGRTIGAMFKRQAALRAAGVRDLTRFDDENPLDLMVVDELVTVLAMRSDKVKVGRATVPADDAFLLFLSQARAAGFSAVCASQLAEKQVIGPVRSLFPYATCLRVGRLERDVVDIMLGKGASNQYPAHLLPVRGAEGVGYTTISGEVRKYRAAQLTEIERREVIAQVRRDTARCRAARRHGMEAAA